MQAIKQLYSTSLFTKTITLQFPLISKSSHNSPLKTFAHDLPPPKIPRQTQRARAQGSATRRKSKTERRRAFPSLFPSWSQPSATLARFRGEIRARWLRRVFLLRFSVRRFFRGRMCVRDGFAFFKWVVVLRRIVGIGLWWLRGWCKELEK